MWVLVELWKEGGLRWDATLKPPHGWFGSWCLGSEGALEVCIHSPLLSTVPGACSALTSVSPGWSCANLKTTLCWVVPDTSQRGSGGAVSRPESSRADCFPGVCDPGQEGRCRCHLRAHPAYPAV